MLKDYQFDPLNPFYSFTSCETLTKYLISIFFNFLIYKIKATILSTSWGHIKDLLSNPCKGPSKKEIVVNFTYRLEVYLEVKVRNK